MASYRVWLKNNHGIATTVSVDEMMVNNAGALLGFTGGNLKYAWGLDEWIRTELL